MSNDDLVRDHVRKQIYLLRNGPDSKKDLATLRRGVGRNVEEDYDSWKYVISGMPEELVGSSGNPSFAEIAVHTALTIYSLHQQSKPNDMNVSGTSFGTALGKLNRSMDRDTVERRFRAILDATDIRDLAYHVKGMVQLMRAATVPIGFDYAVFAKELYRYQFPDSRKAVVFRWGEDFYRSEEKKENNEEGGIKNE